MPYDAIVVGAGHNGLIAAAYLAKAGQKVLVLERSEQIGGAAVSEHPWAGWTVSAASYVVSLLHPDIVRDLDLEAHGYHAYLKDPASFTSTQDGQSLLLWRNPEETRKELSRLSTADVDGLQALEQTLCGYAREIYNSFFDEAPRFDTLSPQARAMFRGSAAEFVEQYVTTPMLQAAIANDGVVGTFEGPRNPGTGYVLAHHYAGRVTGVQGAWAYVRGGMGSISKAAASAAQEFGAVIRSQTPVGMILVDSGNAYAKGVVLEDGTEIESRYVLSGADPLSTFLTMVPSGTLEPQFLERVRNWRCEGPSMKLNLALGELPNFASRPSGESAPHLNATIHIAPDIDYLQRAYEDARGGLPSKEPMLEMFLQTPSDFTLAPKGKHLLSVFAQYFPFTRSDGEWTDARREAAADAIVATIGKYAPNVPNAVEARQILTPYDLERRFGLPKGHIFHGELLPGQIFEERFDVRTPLRGLYLCGSGTHPGGCVSGAPGVRGARAALKDIAAAAAR